MSVQIPLPHRQNQHVRLVVELHHRAIILARVGKPVNLPRNEIFVEWIGVEGWISYSSEMTSISPKARQSPSQLRFISERGYWNVLENLILQGTLIRKVTKRISS